MADAKKCDRCGLFYIPGTGWFGKKQIRIPGSCGDYYDLCENCHAELDRFMDGVPLLINDSCPFICDDTTCPDNNLNKEKSDE